MSGKQIIIVGGGIIGCSTAYYISRHPSFDASQDTVVLLEASDIAGGASGKAGGLLALWAYPSSIVPLSYRLHEELAQEHNGAERWGYRKVNAGQLNIKARPKLASKDSSKAKGDLSSLSKRSDKVASDSRGHELPDDLDWFVAGNVIHYETIGDSSNTAQVHPHQFTSSLAKLAAENGVQIQTKSRVIDIKQDRGVVTGVCYEDTESLERKVLPASIVILTAGPWTQRIYSKVPISAMRAHSVTLKPSRPVSAYVLFTEISMPKGKSKQVSPEIYARPNNEVYACGEGDHLVPLPATTADVEVDNGLCQAIIDQIGSVSDELLEGSITSKQACYLPNVQGAFAGPLIGFSDVSGLLIGAGLTCWGIQNGPGTGKILSEFVFEGEARSADINNLDPRIVL